MLGEFGGLGLLIQDHQWIPGDSFNYEMQESKEQLEIRYLGLVIALRDLVIHPDRCLSAAVYTELTDVEAEVNGWLTYDRTVNKMLVCWGGCWGMLFMWVLFMWVLWVWCGLVEVVFEKWYITASYDYAHKHTHTHTNKQDEYAIPAAHKALLDLANSLNPATRS